MIRRLEWDSAHFGFPIARVEGGDIAASAEEADRAGIRCLYLYSENAAIFRDAVHAGFEPVDVRIELEKKIFATNLDVDLATEADRDWLQSLARGMFETSRFFRDPRFPRERSEEMFAIWIDRAELTVVHRDNGIVTAFCSCTPGRIELVGVTDEARGRGLGAKVIAGAQSELARRGSDEVRVVTQGANIAALRLYEREGFVTRSCGVWFHRWHS